MKYFINLAIAFVVTVCLVTAIQLMDSHVCNAVAQTVTTTVQPDSRPVYKLIGRMDFAISNPKSTAYVFERGGICEYVSANHVSELKPRSEFKLTGYYVKVQDGTFYPLEVEAK